MMRKEILFVILTQLQCDCYNRGHLDKVDQSDDRKITINSEKVSCRLPRNWNEQNGSKSTHYNLNPLKKARAFWVVRWGNDRGEKLKLELHFFTWGREVIANEAMVAKKLLVDDKTTACVKQICLLSFICKVSNRKTLSGETFAFLKNVCINI